MEMDDNIDLAADLVDVQTCCRCCLRNDAKGGIFESIFDFEIDIRGVSELLQHLVGVKLEKNDGLTDRICDDCVKHVKTCVDFRNKMVFADFFLKKCAAKNTSSAEAEGEGSAPVTWEAISEGELIIKDDCQDVDMPEEPPAAPTFVCKSCKNQFNEKELFVEHTELHSKEGIATEFPKPRTTRSSSHKPKPDQAPEEEEKTEKKKCVPEFNNNDDSVDYEAARKQSKRKEERPSKPAAKKVKRSYVALKTGDEQPSTSSTSSRTRKLAGRRQSCYKPAERSAERIPMKKRSMSVDGRSYSAFLEGNSEGQSGSGSVQEETCDSTVLKRSDDQLGEEKCVGQPALPCPKCHEHFGNERDLRIHQSLHNANSMFGCGECKKTFRELHRLQIHLLTHYNRAAFKCEVCPSTFPILSSLTMHYDHHKANCKVMQHCCTACRDTFHYPFQLHKYEMPWTCPRCATPFQPDIYRKERRFACGTCGQRFEHESSLGKHNEYMHAGQPAAPSPTVFLCRNCNKEFASRALALRHERMHAAAKPNACGACKATFLGVAELDKHMLEKHSDYFTCLICADNLWNKQELGEHMKKHRERVKLACYHCGKNFEKPSYFMRHGEMCNLEEEEYESDEGPFYGF